jgi:hypothetical protein
MRTLAIILCMAFLNTFAFAQGNIATKEPPSPPIKKPGKTHADSLKQEKKDTLKVNKEKEKPRPKPQ